MMCNPLRDSQCCNKFIITGAYPEVDQLFSDTVPVVDNAAPDLPQGFICVGHGCKMNTKDQDSDYVQRTG